MRFNLVNLEPIIYFWLKFILLIFEIYLDSFQLPLPLSNRQKIQGIITPTITSCAHHSPDEFKAILNNIH